MADFTPLDTDNDAATVAGGNTEPGSFFGAADQATLLLAFQDRYTGDHKPGWAMVPDLGGAEYPLQFASDREWLEKTRFAVGLMTRRLDRRVRTCWESPTWPGDPTAYGQPIRDLPWFVQARFAPNLRRKGWAALLQKWHVAYQAQEKLRDAADEEATRGMTPDQVLAYHRSKGEG